MIKKTITYTDYDGNQRTEDFYFHLSKAELTQLFWSEKGGLEKFIEKLAKEEDVKRVIELVKEVVLMGYGEKSPDGKRFVKNQELRDSFAQTEAFSDLFMELAGDGPGTADFINGMVGKL